MYTETMRIVLYCLRIAHKVSLQGNLAIDARNVNTGLTEQIINFFFEYGTGRNRTFIDMIIQCKHIGTRMTLFSNHIKMPKNLINVLNANHQRKKLSYI